MIENDFVNTKIECGECGKPLKPSESKACHCKMVFYCDENCQIYHFNRHRVDCKSFKEILHSMGNRSKNPATKKDESPPGFLKEISEINAFSRPPDEHQSSSFEEISDNGFFSFETPFNHKKRNKSFKPTKKEASRQISIMEEFEEFEKAGETESESQFEVNFEKFDEYSLGTGIKRMLLKFRFDEQTLLPFEHPKDIWEIKNFVISPPDGTFMFLKRSSFKADDFISVTFFVDFSPARQKIHEVRWATNEARRNEPNSYPMLFEQHKRLKENVQLLEKQFKSSIEKFLRSGVSIVNSFLDRNNGLYRFAGHSNSQLKNTSCYMVKADRAEIHQTLHSVGNFDEIKDLGKLVRYIGLLFTTVKSPLLLENKDWEVERDVLSKDEKYCFTDGCGRISTELMRSIMVEMGLPIHQRTISAIQIRFKGFKGMLVHDPNAEKIFFTDSMLKFNDRSERSLIGICNWSRPHMPGYLILHYVLLLSTLGIDDEVFERKQEEYNKQLKNLVTDPVVAYNFLRYRDPPLATKFKTLGLTNEIITALRSLKREELTKFTKYQRSGMRRRRRAEIERVRIFIPRSCNVHGVRDTAGKLKSGQVFLSPTWPDGSVRPLRGPIVVGRTPCYSPGDMRVLECVDPGDEYSHLMDVLVFQTDTNSPRPHSDEMSGGDLDGDLYWCCWDPELIPLQTEPPCDYMAKKNLNSRSGYKEESNERIRYFSEHDPTLLGIIDSLYFEYADRFKANCDECRELNRIFSRVVDNDTSCAKKCIDDLRESLKTLYQKPQNFIWRRIEEENKQFRKEVSPNFGIVRRNLGNVKNSEGDKHIVEIHATDYDEPVFIENEEMYLNKLTEGSIVRFESKWDSFLNRFYALNIRVEPNMNIGHLIKNINIGVSQGFINKIYADYESMTSGSKSIGTVMFSAEYMRQIFEDVDECDVPATEVDFLEESFSQQSEFGKEDIYPGMRVEFNLAYDYKGTLLAMDLNVATDDKKENGVHKKQKKERLEKNKERTIKEISEKLKERITSIVKKEKFLPEENLSKIYFLEHFSRLIPQDYNCENLRGLVKHIKEIKITFDAAANCYFSLYKTESESLPNVDDSVSAEELSSELNKGSSFSDISSFSEDDKKVFTKKCYNCRERDHPPNECPKNYDFNSESDNNDYFLDTKENSKLTMQNRKNGGIFDSDFKLKTNFKRNLDIKTRIKTNFSNDDKNWEFFSKEKDCLGVFDESSTSSE